MSEGGFDVRKIDLGQLEALARGQRTPLPADARADLRAAIEHATGESDTAVDQDPDLSLPEDTRAEAEQMIADVVRDESRTAAARLAAEFKSEEFLAATRASVAQSLESASASADSHDLSADSAISDEMERLEREYVEALGTGKLASIVDTNPFARVATTRAISDMQENILRRLGEIKLTKSTPRIGRHADLRNVPVTSLLEYVRFVPEIGIAFIAGNSAKNMIAELASTMETTSQMSYNNRLFLASIAGVVMSWSAYQLRHSLYKDAQAHGNTYAHLPMPRATATAIAYKNVLKRAPVTTTFRSVMAIGVALAGGNVLMNLAGVSGKSVEFGKSTIQTIQPVNERMSATRSVMDAFFKDLEERCNAIVAAEVDPAKAGKGTGKGAKASYGPKAAAKDYLCFGKTEGGRTAPAALVAFRASIGMEPGVSIPQFYRNLWDKREPERARLFASFTEKLATLQQLVQTEADVSFSTRVEQATLKNIPENKIPSAKQELVAAINAYVAEINAYSAEVDAISQRIAKEGIAAAEASGQDIEILAPRVEIDVSPITKLPDSPVGKRGFFLTPELAKGARDVLSGVPGINFVTPLLSKNANLLATQLTLLALLVYLGGENIPNAFFVHRERMRSRRLAREMGPKMRDYYAMLDKVSEQIADIVIEGITPFKHVFGGNAAGFQTREQLIAAIKFAITSDHPAETPDGSEHPLREWAAEKRDQLGHMMKHLLDFGPDSRADLDQAIDKVARLLKVFQKGSPQKVAAELTGLGIPGAEIFSLVFDPKISSDPEKFAAAIAQTELKAMRHSVRYLVLKMQARQFVLDQLGARLASDDRSLTHADEVRDLLSSGVILSLDGNGGKIAASSDEVKYYRVWAELAAEQEQDQRDLLRVALAGKTFWDRRFKVDQGLGTVSVPREFTDEFIASATTEPLSDAAHVVQSYHQMFDRMLERQGNVEDLTNTLEYVNASAIPRIQEALEDEPRLGENCDASFSCSFSTKHGGPVIRCDLTDVTSHAFITTTEAPYILGEGSKTDEEFDALVQDWFREGGPGRLELIARAQHQRMRDFVQVVTSENRQQESLASGALELSASIDLATGTIGRVQRELLLKTLASRQKVRLDSLTPDSVLDEAEMPIFELDGTIYQEDMPARELARITGVSIDGLFQLDALTAALKARGSTMTIRIDLSSGLLTAIKEPPPPSRTLLSRLSRTQTEAPRISQHHLYELNDLPGFMEKISQ